MDNFMDTVEDYVVELNRKTGKIVKRWDLKNVLNMEDGKSENWIAYDWFHNNSVWYNKNTNSITLSGISFIDSITSSLKLGLKPLAYTYDTISTPTS